MHGIKILNISTSDYMYSAVLCAKSYAPKDHSLRWQDLYTFPLLHTNYILNNNPMYSKRIKQ